MKETGFVRTRDLVERYGIAPNTLNRWRQNREFPNPVFSGHGADNFYDVEEVKAWEEVQRAKRNAA
jgi:predicted DNA-binding transcriptional regulator AlpA